MDQSSDHPVTQVMVWAGLNILLPLLPVMFGIAIKVSQWEPVNLMQLFDGIELFLISLWLVTSTAWDMSRQSFRWERPLRILLIGLAVVDIVFLVIIYIHDRVRDLDLVAEAYLNFAMAHFVVIVVIAVALRLLMSYRVYGGGSVEDRS